MKAPCGQPVPGARPGNNGGIDAHTPTPRASRRLSDALIRFQTRAQNNPRRTGRVAGVAFTLLLFLAMGLGFLLAFDDQPLYLRLTLALLGAVLGAYDFTEVRSPVRGASGVRDLYVVLEDADTAVAGLVLGDS